MILRLIAFAVAAIVVAGIVLLVAVWDVIPLGERSHSPPPLSPANTSTAAPELAETLPVQPVAEILPAGQSFDHAEVTSSENVSEWRQWRGPGYQNARIDWTGPQQWSIDKNLLWRKPIDGHASSSPIVVGDRIFLTSSADNVLWLSAINLANGEEVWRQQVFSGSFPSGHQRTTNAASTPVSDGRAVYVAWAGDGKAQLAAYDLTGKQKWTIELGPFSAMWGFSASPAYADGLVLISADNAEDGYLTAVIAATGEIYWRRRRPQASEGSYSSPVIQRAGENAYVVISGLGFTQAFDLSSGELAWQFAAPSTVVVTTPTICDGQCVVSSGYPARLLVALNIGDWNSNGNEPSSPTETWRNDRSSEVPYVPSPLCFGDRVFVVHDDGLAVCLTLADGKTLWKRRLGGKFAASPILLGDKILCVSESGDCYLLETKQGEITEQTQLSEGMAATPVPLQDQLLFRTTSEIMLIGNRK